MQIAYEQIRESQFNKKVAMSAIADLKSVC